MRRGELYILYFCAVITMCTLYGAQPIQPLFESEFSLNKFQASIFTTVIMIPLGVAPIIYGYLLESLPSKKMLQFSALTLGVLEIAFAFSSSYTALITLRALQGLIIPAMLTSITSYISTRTEHASVAQAISTYVGLTIVGGFIGRLISGALSDMYGWRVYFIVLGVILIGIYFLLNRISVDAKSSFSKPTKKQIYSVMTQKHNLIIFLSMFLVFFIFQAVLNFIPFELRSMQSGEFTGTKTGLLYAGYAIGVVVSLNAFRIIRFFGTEAKAMLVGSVIFLISLQFFHIQSYMSMFLTMFLFCLGMFIVHAIASGYINSLATTNKSIANGLYISFYYAGGTLGTFIPGVVYDNFGWDIFLLTLSFVSIFSIVLLAYLLKFTKKTLTDSNS